MEANFEYPKPLMRKGELLKLGIPAATLDAAFRDRGQRFAYKMDATKRNSPIVFETAGFDKWLRKRINVEAYAREIHMHS